MMLLNRFTQLGLTGTPARRYGWDALATPDCLTASAVPATPTLSRSTSVSVSTLSLGGTQNTLNLSRSSTITVGGLSLTLTQEAVSLIRDAIITLESQNLTSALLPVTILTGEGETAVVWLYLYNLRSR